MDGLLGEKFYLDIFISLILLNRAIIPAIIPVHLLALFVALNLFAIGLIILTDCLLVYRNEKELSFLSITEGMLSFLLGGFARFDIYQVTDLISWVLGVYFIILGISRLLDFYFLDEGNYSYRSHLGIPIILSVIIPLATLKKINRLLSAKKSKKIVMTSGEKAEQPVDLEIWIHTARKRFEAIGYVDTSYRGKTYAYGQYDPEKSFLGGINGDGVLFSLSSEDYLKSLSDADWRAVFGYGISSTDDQKRIVERNLSRLFQDTKSFKMTTDK